MVRRVIRLFYGFQFFFSLLLWVPIFYEYQRRVGLNDEQIFSIQSIYYLAFCVLEIPTGFLADRWSHRRCMQSGAGLLVLANLLPVVFPNYDGFLWHFLLIALSRSLISGASSAYLYEFLRANGELGLYKEAEGKARAYSLAGKVVFWAGIGTLMQWHLSLPYTLTAAATAVALYFVWRMPEMPRTALTEKPLIASAKTLGVLLRSPFLIGVMIQGIALFVYMRVAQVNLFQPILNEKGIPLGSHGMIMSLITVFEAVGSANPNWVRKLLRTTDLNAVFILTLVLAISLSMMAAGGPLMAITGLCVLSLAGGAAYPIQRQVINDAIPDSKYRATFLSLESIINRAASAWIISLLGGVMAAGQINAFLHLSAAITILAMAVLFTAVYLLVRVEVT